MDYFAILGQPRRPWLDLESLKAVFLQQSAMLHPDRAQPENPAQRVAATSRFAELNAAYNCLREPKERVLHLLELESGAPPANVQTVPADSIDLFMETGRICREVDQFLAGKNREESPLLKARRFEQALDWTARLQGLQERIHLRREQLLAELRLMNDAWDAAPPQPSPSRAGALPLQRLEELGRALGYNARCGAQTRERLAQLSF